MIDVDERGAVGGMIASETKVLGETCPRAASFTTNLT
jgi:hypothetical protein